MATLSNSFEGGTSGVTISDANSGGANGDAFDDVSIDDLGVIVFDDSTSAHGSMSAKVSISTDSGQVYVAWTDGLTTDGTLWFRAYLMFTAAPATDDVNIIRVLSGSNGIMGTIRVDESGHVGMLYGSGTLGGTSGNTLIPGQWFRVEGSVTAGMTTGAMTCSVYWFADSTAADEILSVTNVNTGASNPVRLRAGIVSNAQSIGPFWLDDLAASDSGAIDQVPVTPTTERHNLCVNPACDVDVTGWGGGSTPTRTAVTGFGRDWAAHYSEGTFLRTASGAVTAGQTYTCSLYLRSNTFNGSGTLYLAWINSGGGDISYTTTSYEVTAGRVTRLSVTGTAPEGAVTANLIADGINFGVTSVDATMVLIEQADALDWYFDGNSPDATWDGTEGASASTLSGDTTESATATLDTGLPAATAAAEASATASATATATAPAATVALDGFTGDIAELDATLPAATSSGAASATASAVLTATFPGAAASADTQAAASASLGANLPAAQAAASATATATGSLTASAPTVSAATAATATASGSLAATLPPAGTSQTAAGSASGSLTAALPAPTTAVTAADTAPGVLDATLPPATTAATASTSGNRLDASLPAAQAAVAGQATASAAATPAPPPPTTGIAATATASGTAAARPAPATAQTAATATASATAHTALPAVVSSATADASQTARLAATLPPPAAAATAQASASATAAIVLPPPTVAVAGSATRPAGTLDATLPAVKAAMAGTSAAGPPDLSDLGGALVPSGYGGTLVDDTHSGGTLVTSGALGGSLA